MFGYQLFCFCPSVSFPRVCPKDWFSYPGRCNSPLQNPANISGAEKQCKETIGAHLPYFKTPFELDKTLHSTMGWKEKLRVWTGGVAVKHGLKLNWQDGTRINDTGLKKKLKTKLALAKQMRKKSKKKYPIFTEHSGNLGIGNESMKLAFFCQLQVAGMNTTITSNQVCQCGELST